MGGTLAGPTLLTLGQCTGGLRGLGPRALPKGLGLAASPGCP